ncbi:MAG TPA: hypothetical protein VFP48_02275 [Steroidobacteraceae bacterium]|nr:hypothetical protein [Steroidobacteraceae bacterium]
MSVPGLDLIRRQQRALAKWVLALFCLVWLQAALLPCAMALVPGGAAGAPEEHCSYCPPVDHAGTHHDQDAAANCSYPDQPQADSRASAVTPLMLALPVLAYLPQAGTADTAPWSDRARPPDRTGPPLAVSYCRFLK